MKHPLRLLLILSLISIGCSACVNLDVPGVPLIQDKATPRPEPPVVAAATQPQASSTTSPSPLTIP